MTRSVENLARTWASIDELCTPLDEDEWHTPTDCPGWSVKDHLSHLVDYESRAIGRRGPEHAAVDLGHTKNPIGESNEVGVDHRRAWPGRKVLEEFREVTGERLAQLRAMGDDDLAREVPTPVGPGTVADMLVLRVMDSWSHEQDVRRALGRPGHVSGPVVEESLDYFARALPYVVGKRAQAPEGATVVFDIDGYGTVAVEVRAGRARRTDAPPPSPDVTLRFDVATFAALYNGRTRSTEGVTVEGDRAIGERVLSNLAVMI